MLIGAAPSSITLQLGDCVIRVPAEPFQPDGVTRGWTLYSGSPPSWEDRRIPTVEELAAVENDLEVSARQREWHLRWKGSPWSTGS